MKDGTNGKINFSTTTIWHNVGTVFVFDGINANQRNLNVDYIKNKNKKKKIIFRGSNTNCQSIPTKIRTRVRAVVVE
jgi:hypothetical protein